MKSGDDMRGAVHLTGDGPDGFAGFIRNGSRRGMRVIVSWGGDWEHVSVSHGNRCPTWTEMCKVKKIFWDPEEVVIQYHPAKSVRINIHPYCLHLWRPVHASLPVPPPEFIG